MEKDYKKNVENIILTIMLPVLLILLWCVATTQGWIRASVLPSPEKVFESAVSLWEKGIFQADLTMSLSRIIKGFLLGAILGIAAGLFIGIFPRLDRATKVVLAVFRPVPIIAWLPIFILWIGIGEELKVTVIALGTFWALLLNTISGIKGVDPKLLELAKMLGKSRYETIRHIILPNAYPFIFTGIRFAIGAALGYVITAEMIAASEGIGYRMMFARNMAQPGIMFVGIIEIGFFGLVVDLLLLKLQNRLFSYR